MRIVKISEIARESVFLSCGKEENESRPRTFFPLLFDYKKLRVPTWDSPGFYKQP